MRVGLTGGIGSGKSAVAQFFASWGAAIIDADVIAREVVAPGTAGLAEIARVWPAVITAEGSLDRAALSHIVFDRADAREALTSIVHPRVRERAQMLEACALPGAIVVHVVPLLFEGDYWKTCERTVVVVAPRTTRIERVMQRDGFAPDAIQARMAAQIEPERAAELADYVIENATDLAALELRARAVFDELQRHVPVR